MQIVNGYEQSRRCRAKVDSVCTGKAGWCYGHVNLGLQQHVIVMWDDEDSPVLFPIRHLEERIIEWRAFE